MEDERVWQAQFEYTTDQEWDRLAQQVRQEIAVGDITPITQEVKCDKGVSPETGSAT